MSRIDFKHDPDTRFKPPDELSLEEARREIESLREGIDYHDHRYYRQDVELLNEQQFKQLVTQGRIPRACIHDLPPGRTRTHGEDT